MPRAKGVQIYLKPGLEEDDRLLAFWRACQRNSRPQEVFRRLLQIGLAEMIERGEVSARILEEMGAEIVGMPVDPLDLPARSGRSGKAPRIAEKTAEAEIGPGAVTTAEPSRPGNRDDSGQEAVREQPRELPSTAPQEHEHPAENDIGAERPHDFDYRNDETAHIEPDVAERDRTEAAHEPKPRHAFIGDIM